MSATTIPVFEWKVDGLSVSISASRTVLGQLRSTLDSNPGEEEFGGILLGKITKGEDGYETVVDGFEPFTIEHRHGTGYTLSPRDQQFLEKRLLWHRRKRRVPVGLYRSHHRRGLYLDQRDFELFQADFRHPASVFLLLRRDQSDGAKGAFFVWEGDDIRRHAGYLEFPVESTPMSEFPEFQPVTPRRRQILARAPKPDVLPPAPVLAKPLPVSKSLAQPAKKKEAPWEAWRMEELLALSRQLPPNPAAARILVTLALPILSFWTAHAIALHRVHRAEIRQQEFAVQPAPLPVPERVNEVAALPADKPQPFAVAPVPSETPPVLTARLEAPPIPLAPASPMAATPATGARDRAAEPNNPAILPRPIVRPIDTIPHATPALPDPPSVEPVRHLASMPRLAPSQTAVTSKSEKVVAYFKPAPTSSMRQAMQRVPLLRGLTGNSLPDGFEAASPLDHPLPKMPADGARIKDGAEVEMLATVDRDGTVSTVKLVGGNRKLADSSAEALLRWRFQPAKVNGAAVESAMRVRFEFHPNQ